MCITWHQSVWCVVLHTRTNTHTHTPHKSQDRPQNRRSIGAHSLGCVFMWKICWLRVRAATKRINRHRTRTHLHTHREWGGGGIHCTAKPHITYHTPRIGSIGCGLLIPKENCLASRAWSHHPQITHISHSHTMYTQTIVYQTKVKLGAHTIRRRSTIHSQST